MNITVTIEFGNEIIEDFSTLENTAHETGMEVARNIITQGLEILNKKVNDERDKARYRNKGFHSTCIKTKCGDVEYSRTVYRDKEAKAGKKHVFLLDEYLGIQKIGMYTAEMCKQISSAVCVSTYRVGAAQISEKYGTSISAQGAWNIVQRLGESQQELAIRNAELVKEHQGKGDIQTKILYEENDGIWLKLQGKSRKENGPSKEMKVGIAYDGVLWKKNKRGQKRRTLDNKISYASFEPIKVFREKKEGLVASKYDVDEIDLRIINGDGANWIQNEKRENTITVLDKFHRNKKIRECVTNAEHAKSITEELHKGDYDQLLEYIEALINSVEEEEAEGLKELYKYYSENKESLSGPYERDIEIPETRAPGEVHHARLGSMESNIFTIIGNRMKGRRHCWSINGANNLAALLCNYHTIGLESLFDPLPAPPIKEEEWVDEGKALSADKAPKTDGKGYEYPKSVSSDNEPSWLKEMTKIDMSFVY